MEKNLLDWITLALIIIGGINWGLVGIFKVDLVALLFGTLPAVVRIIYALVGFSALSSIYTLTKN